jgi:hypothetical protein
MAITTLDGALAGMLPAYPFLKIGGTMEAAGVMHSLAYATGLPGAMAAPSSGLAGAAITSRAGLYSVPAPAGANLSYLAALSAAASVAGQLIIVDRLWDNSGFTVTTTTAQTVTSATWPARDRDGATDGVGVMLGIEVSTATTNAGAITNMTASYTDSGGTAGNTATVASFPITAAAGTFVPFQLAAGDVGVRAVASLTLGTSLVTGTVHLVAYRELARISMPVANVGANFDAIATGFARLYDNTTLSLLWLPTATTATTVSGNIVFSQG